LKARSKYSAWCPLSYSIYETVAADGTYTCIKDLKIPPNNETDDTEINNNCLSYVEDSNNNSENDSDDEK